MSEQSKEAQNKIVSKFMGIDFDQFKTVSNWSPAKYDEYWEQLMPVIGRIEELGFCVIIVQFTASIRPFSYMGNFPQVYFNDSTKLKAAHKAVIKFIKWYNKSYGKS